MNRYQTKYLVVVFLLQLLAGGYSIPTCRNECFYESQYRIADCSEADLDQIPSHQGCTYARVLDLSFNSVTSLPNNSFHRYRDVENLDVSSNAIIDVHPGTFLGLEKVISIDLSQNQITMLPKLIFYSVKDTIQQIHLDRNDIAEISDGTFNNLTQLSALFLGHNQLTVLSPTLFKDLSALLRLHLNSNQLTHISYGLLAPLQKLKILDLSSNLIQVICLSLFDFSCCLETITLTNNRLQYIPRPESSESLMGLQTLDIRNNNISDATNISYFIHETDKLLLEGNPFKCDCSFNDLREWIQRDMTSRMACTWTCINPVTMESVLARDLSPEDTKCPEVTKESPTTNHVTTNLVTTNPTDDSIPAAVESSKEERNPDQVKYQPDQKVVIIPPVLHNITIHGASISIEPSVWFIALIISVAVVLVFVLISITVILAICLCQTNKRIEKMTAAILESQMTPKPLKSVISRLKDANAQITLAILDSEMTPRRVKNLISRLTGVSSPRKETKGTTWNDNNCSTVKLGDKTPVVCSPVKQKDETPRTSKKKAPIRGKRLPFNQSNKDIFAETSIEMKSSQDQSDVNPKHLEKEDLTKNNETESNWRGESDDKIQVILPEEESREKISTESRNEVNITENIINEKENMIDEKFSTKSPPPAGQDGIRKRTTPNNENKTECSRDTGDKSRKKLFKDITNKQVNLTENKLPESH